VLNGTANPDGAGILLRGLEYQPRLRQDFEPGLIDALVRLARLAGSVAESMSECPDAAVRRSAAVLAARAHPVLVALSDD
jgi:hypothetical protein